MWTAPSGRTPFEKAIKYREWPRATSTPVELMVIRIHIYPLQSISHTGHDGFLSSSNLISQIKQTKFIILQLKAIAISFNMPEYTSQVDALGTLRVLESMRSSDLYETKFYQASTSELYGDVVESPQSEKTPFRPRSPYAISKLYSYWLIKNYREAYNMHASNGILFNHESPRRGENFVTRKITRGLARIKYGLDQCLYLGNIDSKRDWGHAKDYVYAQWLITQQEQRTTLLQLGLVSPEFYKSPLNA